MNRENLLHLYEKLTALVSKLPGGLQTPILNELVPIRQLFLEQRPARLLLLGEAPPETEAFIHALLPTISPQEASASQARSTPALLETGMLDNGWRTFRQVGRGDVLVFDARGESTDSSILQQALRRHTPDAVVLFQGAEGMAAAHRFQEALDVIGYVGGLSVERAPRLAASETHKQAKEEKTSPTSGKQPFSPPPALLALYTGEDLPAGVERLRALLQARRELNSHALRVLPLAEGPAIAEAICAFLPNPAKLEFALMGDIRPAQAEIARSLLKSFTAVCGVIGMQPIPLADLPILTTLQSLMVGLIAYVSGRKMSPQSVTEFFGAVGLSFGLGMLFREGARALVKVVPGFGNAVSGMVAGAGTYAIGRAAIAYFIERVPASETRRLFQKIRPRKSTFLLRHSRSKPEA